MSEYEPLLNLLYALSFAVVAVVELFSKIDKWKSGYEPDRGHDVLEVNVLDIVVAIALAAIPVFNTMYVVIFMWNAAKARVKYVRKDKR
jgi:hypothetical protein